MRTVCGHPCQLPALLKPTIDVAAERNLFCARYDICLDEAVAGNWTSWSCAGCAVFELQKASGADHSDASTRRRGVTADAVAAFSAAHADHA